MNSKLHTQKTIVTVGELVAMVKDGNWKKDISYILTEQYDPKSYKWKELGDLEPVSEVGGIDYKNGHLLIVTPESNYSFSDLGESSLMREVVTRDNPELRCTVYTT